MRKVQKGLIHVVVNNTTGNEYMIKNKDVEYDCHDENMRKISLKSNTPLIHRRISQEIVFDGTSEIFLKILQGRYNAPPYTYDYKIYYL